MRITKAQYKGLDAYKYSGMDKSVVSRYILGPFWNWLVLLFPTNLAPNMVRTLDAYVQTARN
jgi:ethanolaminephosphotransferase